MRFMRIVFGVVLIGLGLWLGFLSIKAAMASEWLVFSGGLSIACFFSMLGLVCMFESLKRFFKELFSNSYWW